uniref:SHSP domain-containing protein n=1 Tax=Rhabditophanes sp. KR3021 TaxID=114890 RepID=A0AC35TL48_9BILA
MAPNLNQNRLHRHMPTMPSTQSFMSSKSSTTSPAYSSLYSSSTANSYNNSINSNYRRSMPSYIAPEYNTFGDKYREPKNPFDYSDSVQEMDRQLTKIREKPSKIVKERKRIIVYVDMSNFKPEDIEVQVEQGRLIVIAEQEVELNKSTTITKRFSRKFVIPDDVRHECIATELDKYGQLKITALRAN